MTRKHLFVTSCLLGSLFFSKEVWAMTNSSWALPVTLPLPAISTPSQSGCTTWLGKPCWVVDAWRVWLSLHPKHGRSSCELKGKWKSSNCVILVYEIYVIPGIPGILKACFRVFRIFRPFRHRVVFYVSFAARVGFLITKRPRLNFSRFPTKHLDNLII